MNHHNINKILQNIMIADKKNIQSAEIETTDFLVNLISLVSARRILEIGTHLGYTALKILASNDKVLVTTVDFGEKYKPFIKHLPKNIKNRVTFIHLSAGDYYSKIKNNIFDVAFIDADHTYLAAFRDFIHILPHIGNGVIVFHDSLNPYFPGVRNIIKLIRFVNFLTFGFFCDIMTLITPYSFKVSPRPPSGITIVKIKGIKILYKTIYPVFMLIYTCSYLLIFKLNISKKFNFYGNDNSF
jgi:SAM-dependent methyltransferase